MKKGLAVDYNAKARSMMSGVDLSQSFNQENVNNIPGYEGSDSNQSDYYDNPYNMESDSNSQMHNSESGNLVNNVFYKSSQFEVNPNEEWLQNGKEAKENPSDFISIVSSTDENCSDIASVLSNKDCKIYYKSTDQTCTNSRVIDVETYHQYQCFKDKESYQRSCASNLDLICQETQYTLPQITYNDFEGFSFSYPYINLGSGRRVGQNCSGYIYELKFNLDNIDAVEALRINRISVDDRVVFYINGKEIFKYPNSNGCELWATRTTYPNFNLKPYLRVGENIIKVRFVVGGLGNFTSRLEMRYKSCKTYSSNDWQEICDIDLGSADDSCIEKQKICNSANQSRNIGQNVTEFRDCWGYDIIKECQPNNLVNYCEDLHYNSSCSQISSSCLEEDNLECINFENNYKCQNQDVVTGNKVTYQGLKQNIESEYINSTNCDEFSNSSYCSFKGEECLDQSSSLTKNIEGLDISRDCWDYEQNYSCLSQDEEKSDCGVLSSDRLCSLSSQSCLDYDNNFCIINQKSYACQESESDIAICSAPVDCESEDCEEISYQEDQNFAKAVSNLSILEQATMDLQDDLSTFTGTLNKCSKDLVNYADCCDMGGWGEDLGGIVTSITTGGVAGVASASLGGVLLPSISAGASVEIVNNIMGGSCSTAEKDLYLRNQLRQCVYVGEYCSAEEDLTGTCFQEKHTSCCFNSKLARIIQEQGRQQLGIGWGTAKNPNCSGIAIDDLQKVDFSQMDFSELAHDANNNVSQNIPSHDEIVTQIEQAISNHYEEAE